MYNMVTVLNEYTKQDFHVISIIAIGIFIFGVCVMCGINEREVWLGLIMGLIVAPTFMVVLYIITTTEREPYTVYEVLIDDGVDYKEFTSKYEVLDKSGDIYTVRLIEEE